jgi:hypothetical protein
MNIRICIKKILLKILMQLFGFFFSHHLDRNPHAADRATAHQPVGLIEF